jgi:hypothetical protein
MELKDYFSLAISIIALSISLINTYFIWKKDRVRVIIQSDYGITIPFGNHGHRIKITNLSSFDVVLEKVWVSGASEVDNEMSSNTMRASGPKLPVKIGSRDSAIFSSYFDSNLRRSMSGKIRVHAELTSGEKFVSKFIEF